MCNARNHPPGCRCGFGGGGNQDYARYFLSSKPLESEVFRKPQLASAQKARTSPANCPWCGAGVFYHTNGNGDSVYFDGLGKPWEIHACFNEYWQQEKERRKLLGSLPESQHFLSSTVDESEKDKRLLLGAIQNIHSSLTEEAIAKQIGLSKRDLRKHYGDFYKPKGFSDNAWKAAVNRAVTGKGDGLTTEASLDFREAIFGCEKVVEVYSEVEKRSKKLRITVPPGVDSQTRLRVSGEGEVGGSNGTPGDLYVHLKVEMTKGDLIRKGIDVTSSLKILPNQALHGGEVELNTLDGKVVIILPQKTRNGQNFRLKGFGVPKLNFPDERGDQIIRISFE